MTSFTTRVELHERQSEDKPDYELLHEKMEAKGFKRTITTDDGTVYHLPTAEYNYVGSIAINEVHDLAVKAVSETLWTGAIIVSQATKRIWSGLKVVVKHN